MIVLSPEYWAFEEMANEICIGAIQCDQGITENRQGSEAVQQILGRENRGNGEVMRIVGTGCRRGEQRSRNCALFKTRADQA